MTVISDSDFRNPNQLGNLPGYSSSRFLDPIPESVSVVRVCQDSQNPSLVVIDFSIAGSYYFTPIVNILDVDGDGSYHTNQVVAPLFLTDERSSSIPINTYGGVVNAKIVADFGRVIPNFLYAQRINFELRMVGSVPISYGVSFPAQSPTTSYLWEKGVLPTPIDISYNNGVLQVFFEYNGQVDCLCNIQCVEPSGVASRINFCPNDTQSIVINQGLSGDPFTFNLLLTDAIGNLSEFTATSYINVNPANPIVALRRPSKSGPLRTEIGISNLSKNGVSIVSAEYQIVKYTNSPHNYIVWKDWSERPWTNFIDYEIKPGNTYGYAVRYKGKFNDISNLSQWTTISTIDKVESPPAPRNFGAWTRAWNHDSNETDATIAFPGMLGVLSNNNNKAFPDKFMAVHMSLIPKGPQRGSVIVWDRSVVVASVPAINPDPLVYWSIQPWAIVDPSDTPSGYTHRNYLLPIGPVEYTSGVFYFPNIFCAGQAWSQNGDLIVGGGVRWDSRGLQYGDTRTYAWNPAVPTSFLSGPHKGPVTCQALNGGHYGEDNEGYGAWVQGPDIGVLRYYPTLTLSPSISRQLGKPAMLIFGGTVDLFNATLEGNSSWNSYEALIVQAQATSGDCGFYLDTYNGSSIFAGPSDLDNPYEDSLYFYPRMISLSNGSIFMAGFAPRSAALIDHDTQPGVWSITNGNTYVDGLINNQRYYGSAVLMPNIDGKEDNIIRIGGGLTLPGEDLTVWDTNTTEIIEATSTTSTDWRPGPTLNRVRSLGAVVVLPDASIMMFGGVDADENIFPRMPRGRDTIVAQEETHPLIAHDHHGEIIADTFAPQDEQMHEEEATSAVASAVGGIINGFQISHLAPEILFPGAKEWILMDWAPAKSTRNYHCSAVLLPDTRILVAGGEAREWDYEIFEPHYIRPGDGFTPNKPKNIVITDATIDTAKDHGAYDLSYNTEYTIECADLYPDRLGKIVLMSPGSFTHHNDMSQSYRELQVSLVNRNKIKFKTPLNDKVWQKGFHMLFALSNQGIPANAIWVKFS
jgi:hypothetical protein